MAIALTVFGISGAALPPTLCYVLLRQVRGPGQYPQPTLPKQPWGETAISNMPLDDTELTLLGWDAFVAETGEQAVLEALRGGRFLIPQNCPIAPGSAIAGIPFGPVLIEEGPQRASISGSGVLLCEGLATDKPLVALKDALRVALPPGTMPAAVEAIVQMIAVRSGMDDVFKGRRALGGVDYFYRPLPPARLEGVLFDVEPDRGDLRSPMLKVHIRRHAAPPGRRFRLQVRLENYDTTLGMHVLDVEPVEDKITVAAPAHITDVSVTVFGEDGEVMDLLEGSFLQGMDFGLAVIGKSDTLPPAFAGVPPSPDIENRSRIVTSTFGRPAPESLSGGLGVLRKAAATLDDTIGKPDAKPENVWFDRGAEGQLAIIRWIKAKIETPGVTKAILVDPYLGSDALKRVIVRQGNDSVDLQIVISPGNVDPDAEDIATNSGGLFISRLVEAATAWSEKLAGQIEVVHVKRGTGARQAFHDRYLITVSCRGIPTVYLLSNSLSKAAGDWPFVISELNRVMAWRVYADVQEMLEGRILGCVPEAIWKRERSSGAGTVADQSSPAAADNEPSWIAPARVLLNNVYKVIIQNGQFKASVGALFDGFLASMPGDLDVQRFAQGLFEVVKHRDKIVVFTSEYFRDRGQVEIAGILDARFIEKTLQEIRKPGEEANWHINFEDRKMILQALGRAIAYRPDPTTFVRDELNPKVQAHIGAIETQRLNGTLPWSAQETALFLCIMALEVAAVSDAPVRFRIGLASDYIHWVGRLARSDPSRIYDESGPAEYRNDLALAGQQIMRAYKVLGDELRAPIQRVLNDELVAPALKALISPALAQSS